MDNSKVRTITPEERVHWEQSLAGHAAERPEIDAQMDAFRAAAEEESFSGHLRQTIHQSRVPLRSLCQKAGVIEFGGVFGKGNCKKQGADAAPLALWGTARKSSGSLLNLHRQMIVFRGKMARNTF